MLIGRLTDEEYVASCRKHNLNTDIRRLTDEEYNKLQEREAKVRRYIRQQKALMKGGVVYE